MPAELTRDLLAAPPARWKAVCVAVAASALAAAFAGGSVPAAGSAAVALLAALWWRRCDRRLLAAATAAEKQLWAMCEADQLAALDALVATAVEQGDEARAVAKLVVDRWEGNRHRTAPPGLHLRYSSLDRAWQERRGRDAQYVEPVGHRDPAAFDVVMVARRFLSAGGAAYPLALAADPLAVQCAARLGTGSKGRRVEVPPLVAALDETARDVLFALLVDASARLTFDELERLARSAQLLTAERAL